MHPFTIAVFDRLSESRANLRAAVEAVPPAARAQKPAPDRWSINEVLEHLSLVETLFTNRIATAIDKARDEGLGLEQASERAPLPANIETIVADRSNPRTAPEAARPQGNLDATTAWHRVEQARAVLRDTLGAADGLALSAVMESHPFFGALSVYQFAELIAAHEGRHTAQVKEIAARLAGV
jgi:uncharacterized damage-inducible protein DinB